MCRSSRPDDDPGLLRFATRRWLASFVCLAAIACLPGGTPPSGTDVIAIVDATIVPMDAERVLPDQTVVVRDGSIAAIGARDAIDLPATARRIDGSGLYLAPGLIDAHVHLRDSSELISYLTHGVTTAVHLSGPTGNVSDVLDLRARVLRGEVVAPTIYSSGRIVDGDPPIFRGVSTIVRTVDEARNLVDAQVAAGVDVIKVYNNVSTDVLQAVTQRAHTQGVTVWGHVPRIDGRASALPQALAARLDVIAHGEEVFFTLLYRDVEGQLDRGLVPVVSDDLLAESVRLIRESGAAVIPNLSFVAMTRVQLDDIADLWDDPELRFLHPATVNTWKEQNPTRRTELNRFDRREQGKHAVVRRLTHLLSEAGVPLLLGTDSSAPGMFPGKSAHIELTELVKAGLTPYEALATGTRNAGRFLSEHVRGAGAFGTVEVGSRADLLVLEANPLVDVSNVGKIAGIIVRGKWFSRAQLDSMRAEASARFAH